MQGAICRAQTKVFNTPLEKGKEVTVADGYAFGLAGRPGGVDDIGQVCRGELPFAPAFRTDILNGRTAVRPYSLRTNHDLGPGIGQDIAVAGFRRFRVEGHIAAAGRQYAEDGHDQLDRPFQRDGHRLILPYPLFL